MFWIPLKGTCIETKQCTYDFQLVLRHSGICRSVNHEEEKWRPTAVSIYKPKNNKHIFTLENTMQCGSARLSSGTALRHGGWWQWVAWSMSGSGKTCSTMAENQDGTLNTEYGCIHHGLMPLSGGDTALNQRSWLSPSAMQDSALSMMDLHSLLFKCAHALWKRTMGRMFLVQLISQLILGWSFITHTESFIFCQIISKCSQFLLLLLSRYCFFFRSSLPELQSSSCLSGLVLACGFGSFGSCSYTRTDLSPPPLPSASPPVLLPAHTCQCIDPGWGHSRRSAGVMRSQTVLRGSFG